MVLKPCDVCNVNVGNYKENEYTHLCGLCWTKVALATNRNWEQDKKYYPWIYDVRKLL